MIKWLHFVLFLGAKISTNFWSIVNCFSQGFAIASTAAKTEKMFSQNSLFSLVALVRLSLCRTKKKIPWREKHTKRRQVHLVAFDRKTHTFFHLFQCWLISTPNSRRRKIQNFCFFFCFFSGLIIFVDGSRVDQTGKMAGKTKAEKSTSQARSRFEMSIDNKRARFVFSIKCHSAIRWNVS